MLTANARSTRPSFAVGASSRPPHSAAMNRLAALARQGPPAIGFAGLVSVGNEVDLSLGTSAPRRSMTHAIGRHLLFRKPCAGRRLARVRAPQKRSRAFFSASGPRLHPPKLGRSAKSARWRSPRIPARSPARTMSPPLSWPPAARRVENARRDEIEGLRCWRACHLPRQGTACSGRREITTRWRATWYRSARHARQIADRAPSAATLARLAAAGIAVKPARLIDLTLAGTRYDVMKGRARHRHHGARVRSHVAVVGSSRASIASLQCGQSSTARTRRSRSPPISCRSAGSLRRSAGRRAELPRRRNRLRHTIRRALKAAQAAGFACEPRLHHGRRPAHRRTGSRGAAQPARYRAPPRSRSTPLHTRPPCPFRIRWR